MKNLIVLNLKVYGESLGRRGLELSRIAEAVGKGTGARIIVVPQTVDLADVVKSVSIPVFAQHVDPNDQGAFTGTTTAEAVKEVGCKGTLINHSEKRLRVEEIGRIVEKCRRLNLDSLVCAATTEESRALASLRPDYIAVEPPELIGSGISVSSAKPEIVRNTVLRVKEVADIPVLCGAGISNGKDVKKAVELGASGVLLASAYVKAKDPKTLLMEMAENI
ncbi:triose-phosphate isomerase [Candidatus Micrarchaeota archaeon]|nr:triose-phosphate isomerase [Candidatus Micrarchaeota archaeon]